jgi:23S rRNA pseudouridine1911/1915/1917 synthase
MKNEREALATSPEDVGKRIDALLAQVLGISRTQAVVLIEKGRIKIGEKVVKKASEKLKSGHSLFLEPVDVELDEEVKIEVKPVFPEIEILKETDDYIVFNKPSGLLVHETEAHEPVTLAAWLLKHYPKMKGIGENPVRPGIVHRLDKDASGVLVVAKTQKMFDSLKDQFKNRTIEKEYRVLVHGVVEKDNSKIDFAIDRGSDGKMVSRPRVEMVTLKNVSKIQEGKDALTEFTVLQRFINYSLLAVRIYTGRTHQIRVHLFAYNHPVVGDTLYFQKRLEKFNKGIGRLFLHSFRIGFTDLNGEKVEVESPLPERLEEFLKKIK